MIILRWSLGESCLQNVVGMRKQSATVNGACHNHNSSWMFLQNQNFHFWDDIIKPAAGQQPTSVRMPHIAFLSSKENFIATDHWKQILNWNPRAATKPHKNCSTVLENPKWKNAHLLPPSSLLDVVARIFLRMFWIIYLWDTPGFCQIISK